MNPKPSIEKLAEKFQLIFSSVINTYEDMPPKLCVVLANETLDDGTDRGAVLLAYYTIDDDTSRVTYHPLAELLTGSQLKDFSLSEDVVLSHDITCEMYAALQRTMSDPEVVSEPQKVTPDYFENRPAEDEWSQWVLKQFPEPEDN